MVRATILSCFLAAILRVVTALAADATARLIGLRKR
jgi:hypothetical protein